jgi:23S rRNA pseudouridine1911/1915/1917 synthase
MASARLIFAGTPTRIDRYLRDELGAGFGRRHVAVLLRAGAVRVNGRVAAKSTALQPGDEITLDTEAAAATPLRPTPAALAVVHCDAELVAIDKPPGMPSTAGANAAPSVAGALLHRFPEMAAIDGGRGAGLVHRLDTGTSGLLVAARTPAAYRRLRDAFTTKALVKEYLAVVRGRIATAGVVALPLARHPRSRKRMIVIDDGASGWMAETEYRPIAQADDLSLVQLRMRTGVTHQLRVHLAHLGYPVLGDRRYGRRANAAASRDEHTWHFLHALRIRAERSAVLGEITTPFPTHWAPLFERLGWSIDLPPKW